MARSTLVMTLDLIASSNGNDVRQAMAWEGAKNRLPAIAAQGSEGTAAALTSDEACNTAARRNPKEGVSFMVAERNVG